MVPVLSLWMPILLSAIIVFFVSFVIHMLTPLHWNDWRRLPREEETMAVLRPLVIPPGDYAVPCAGSPSAMKDPKFQERMAKGPVFFMTVIEPGPVNMGPQLAQWFVYSVIVSFFAAYIGGRALGPGADYLAVIRFVGSTAFLSYAMGLPQNSIWYRRNWTTTLKSMLDGLLYGLVTAGTFGWLWPR